MKVVDVQAAKQIMLHGISEFNGISGNDVVDLLLDEIKVLQANCSCPYVVAYIDSFRWGGTLITVTELCEPGDLDDVVKSCKPTQGEQQAVLYCVIGAVKCLHDHRFVHGDIKASNALLARDGTVKLCDFGGAEKMRQAWLDYVA